jgi:hypothetical protein
VRVNHTDGSGLRRKLWQNFGIDVAEKKSGCRAKRQPLDLMQAIWRARQDLTAAYLISPPRAAQSRSALLFSFTAVPVP